jgi:hypothetical protein
MKFSLTLALCVLASSLANATLNYSNAEFDWTVPLSESTISAVDFFAIALPPDLLQPDWIEASNTNIVKYTFAEDPDAPFAATCAWIELFHER